METCSAVAFVGKPISSRSNSNALYNSLKTRAAASKQNSFQMAVGPQRRTTAFKNEPVAEISSDVCSRRQTLRKLVGGPLLSSFGLIFLSSTPITADAAAIDDVRRTVLADFVEKQYYVTGELTKDLYAKDCLFVDPTTKVTGVETYTTAIKTLFDPQNSKAELINLQVVDDRTLLLKWRLEGTLRLGGLRIKPYTGQTMYSLDDSGLIRRHFETWDISAVDAFVSCIFPGFGAPPAPPVEELRALEG